MITEKHATSFVPKINEKHAFYIKSILTKESALRLEAMQHKIKISMWCVSCLKILRDKD